MTSPTTPSPLMSLIKHAQRHMAYMRTSRQSYATPAKWVQRQNGRIIDDVATTPDLARVDRGHTSLAARWAVADARRADNPEHARRLDREVEDTGVSTAELQAARWNSYERGWRDATHRHERQADPSTPSALGAAGVPVAAGMVVAAGLYANAADWDEQAPDQITVTDANWVDPVAVPDTTAQVESEDFDPEAALPDNLHAASIEQQLGHVAANSDGSQPVGGEAPVVSTAPEVSAAPGVGM